MSFVEELKRRNVVRVGLAYVVIGWVLAQIAEFAFENFGAPEWVPQDLRGSAFVGPAHRLVLGMGFRSNA